MVVKNNQFATMLRSNGYSVTQPRQAVFTALEHSEPQSMHQLIEQLPGIDRATVYRVIDLFQSLGIVKRLQIGWKYKLELSDAFNTHHHHLSCSFCGQITPIHEDDQIEHLIAQLGQKHRFQIHDHQLEVQGLCASCQQK